MQFLIYSKETNRQAATITPVQLSGNEIYKILKKKVDYNITPILEIKL